MNYLAKTYAGFKKLCNKCFARTNKKLKPLRSYLNNLDNLDRKSSLYMIGLVLGGILLLLTSIYGGWHASNDYSTNSNAVILTQLFSGHISYPVILPGPHATLLIIPLVFLQGHLPYHYTSFTLVNIGLVVLTMFAWAYLLIKLFGRKYEVPILVLLSSLIFTAVAFSLSLAYTTIRNIEYPIVLWFVMIIAGLLQGTKYTRKQLAGAIVGTVLFIITLAGDSFFTYAILLPLGVVIVWYWIQSQKFTTHMMKALALMVGTYICAAVLKLILGAAGIIFFDYGFWHQNIILPTSRLWQSLGIALTQTIELHGANIFGQVIELRNAGLFINFGLMLAGIISLVLILSRANKNYRAKKGLADNNDFVLVVMAISFIVVFLIYVVSGYAIATLPNGQVVDAKNARYISLLPLITVIGLIWMLKTYYNKRAIFLCLCVVLVGSIVTSYPRVHNDYATSAKQLELAPPRASIDQIVDTLKQNHVTAIVSDYWYGPVMRFWTNNGVDLAPQVGCNASILANPESGNFTKDPGRNSALIVDRGNLNYGFWQCTDEQLLGLYGTPSKVLKVQGAGANPPVQVWIYPAITND
jgi:hypothetical protein